MKIVNLIFGITLVFSLASCGDSKKDSKEIPTQEFLKERIQEMDDSLQQAYEKIMNEGSTKIPSLLIYEAINRQLDFYHNYPTDPFSANCLDKVHQLYMQEKVYDKSVEYADTLLLKFPNYKYKKEVLLSIGSTYDTMLGDTSMVRKYYTKLLKEVPNLDKETKSMVQFRLKNLSLSFDELIDLQLKNIAAK